MRLPLPDPEALPGLRRRALLERRLVVLVGAMGCVSLVASVPLSWFAAVALRVSWATSLPALALVTGLLAWAGAWAWSRRGALAAARALRGALDLPTPGVGWLVVPAATLALTLFGLGSDLRGWVDDLPRTASLLLLWLGVAGVASRKITDPLHPGWVSAVILGWCLVGAAMLLGAADRLSPEGTVAFVGIWIGAAPFGAPASAVGSLVLQRTDPRAGWALTLAPLLLPAHRARALRSAGRSADARGPLHAQLAGPALLTVSPALLYEVGLHLAAAGDLRAIAAHAWSAHAFPDDPRPFVGLGEALAAHDPAAALAYARHAEECEARGLLGAPDPARALRERLERG